MVVAFQRVNGTGVAHGRQFTGKATRLQKLPGGFSFWRTGKNDGTKVRSICRYGRSQNHDFLSKHGLHGSGDIGLAASRIFLSPAAPQDRQWMWLQATAATYAAQRTATNRRARQRWRRSREAGGARDARTRSLPGVFCPKNSAPEKLDAGRIMTSGLKDGGWGGSLRPPGLGPTIVAEARVTSGMGRATRPRLPLFETTEAAATAAARGAIERRLSGLPPHEIAAVIVLALLIALLVIWLLVWISRNGN
jgi:hypothetical protein